MDEVLDQAALRAVRQAVNDWGNSIFGAPRKLASLVTSVENQTAARSRIMDADFAKETAELTRTQILTQAGTAMLAQANQAPQSVLSLLR